MTRTTSPIPRRRRREYLERDEAVHLELARVVAHARAPAAELRDDLGVAQALAAEGVATVEIKSGYGLDIESELKMLAVSRQLGDAGPVNVRTTLLASHALQKKARGGG